MKSRKQLSLAALTLALVLILPAAAHPQTWLGAFCDPEGWCPPCIPRCFIPPC